MARPDYLKLAGCVFACLMAGFIGSIATTPAIPAWYASLNKPWFSPPNWLFGPVWTILYILMGVSLYLVIKGGVNDRNRKGFYLFGAQLSLNILWSIIFFGLKNPFFAFIEILFLAAMIILTIIEFRKSDKRAAWLLAPYLAWVIFATVLNLYVWMLN